MKLETPNIISRFRKLYQNRFIFRCLVFTATVFMFFVFPNQFDVMSGWNFFHSFTVFHLLWALWMFDMVMQLVPSRKYWPMGSQKFLKSMFQPLKDYLGANDTSFAKFIIKSNRDTLLVGLIWLLLIGAVSAVYYTGLIGRNLLMVISVAFYVCDLICVLFWCPFRVWFMKNRCCTTCRIFNWDHMMMFSPIVFVPGFFTWSLCLASLVVFFVWEITFALHPERFWEGTNSALLCSNCTDVLCGKRNCRVDVPVVKAEIEKVEI